MLLTVLILILLKSTRSLVQITKRMKTKKSQQKGLWVLLSNTRRTQWRRTKTFQISIVGETTFTLRNNSHYLNGLGQTKYKMSSLLHRTNFLITMADSLDWEVAENLCLQLKVENRHQARGAMEAAFNQVGQCKSIYWKRGLTSKTKKERTEKNRLLGWRMRGTKI